MIQVVCVPVNRKQKLVGGIAWPDGKSVGSVIRERIAMTSLLVVGALIQGPYLPTKAGLLHSQCWSQVGLLLRFAEWSGSWIHVLLAIPLIPALL